MKTCPICSARCFDDMDTCYGCMHRFADGASDGKTPSVETDRIEETEARADDGIRACEETPRKPLSSNADSGKTRRPSPSSTVVFGQAETALLPFGEERASAFGRSGEGGAADRENPPFSRARASASEFLEEPCCGQEARGDSSCLSGSGHAGSSGPIASKTPSAEVSERGGSDGGALEAGDAMPLRIGPVPEGMECRIVLVVRRAGGSA